MEGCSINTPKPVAIELIKSQTSVMISPTPTQISPTPSLTPTETAPLINQICSPLANVPIGELEQIITQPFKQPPAGFDYDHQGVDFSFYRRNDQVGILGVSVNSVLPGKVVAIMREKYVYGNAIIIETQLDQLPQNWLSKINPPPLSPTITPDSRLTCPTVESDTFSELDSSVRSLYVLYAHLNQAPIASLGDEITCGQKIGEVGSSGKSTNPHLHLETRIGPSNATFSGIAHYDNRATAEEMHNYCVWRVSNLFQMFDPMKLLHVNN